jgi:tetratricopeptide (TPR) repeat protein
MKSAPALSKLYPPRLWAVALLVMVAFVAIDTVVHLRTTWDLVARHSGAPPVSDPASPSGYADNQHELILPYPGIDTYHWIMQTQSMFAGAGARIRTVDYDNAPNGREVHWSSLIRWWLAALAWTDHATTLTPLPQAVEDVAPFGSVLLIVLLISLATPLVARRFGSIAAALFAIGAVGVGPFYESFSVGRTDHHGLTALADLLAMLLLIGGGAGWVRARDEVDPVLGVWLPLRPQARTWFIASGIVGGIGLWVSAASVVPVLAYLGLGALLATGLLGRGIAKKCLATPDPSLWRVWGWSGAATSLFFYLLEYFPSHLGMRLEVNHPLYALAWAGGGEIIFRLSRWWSGGALAPKSSDWLWLLGSLAAVAALPVVLFLFGNQVFTVGDPFLWRLHNDYIEEFFGLWRFLNSQPFIIFLIFGSPLLLLALPMVAWNWPALRQPLRWCLILGGVLAAVWGAITVIQLLGLPSASATLLARQELLHRGWMLGLLTAAAILALMTFWQPWGDFPRPAGALLLLALPPTVIMFGQAVAQVRWVEISYALWLGALVAVAAALRLHQNYKWNIPRILAAVFFLLWALAPNPAFTIYSWVQGDWKGSVSEVEALELINRNVAQSLRAREGHAPLVVVSGATSSTWLLYWGGFKSLGTYYWENLAGMKANADIYAARTPDEALALLQAHHATHLVILTWVDAPAEYTHVARNLSADQPSPPDAFILNLLHGGTFPTWLRPIYYQMPPGDDYKNLAALIFAIDPQQTRPLALAHLAQWQMQMGNAEIASHILDDALQLDPACIPAIVTAARLDVSANKKDLFTACIQRLRALLPQATPLEFADHVDLVTVFGLANDGPILRTQMDACVRAATPANLRTLRPDALYNFLSLARTTGLLGQRPGLWDVANPLLPIGLRLQLLLQFADQDKLAHNLPQSVAKLRQALALDPATDPNSITILNRLAWLLATSADDSIRNATEAVALGTRAFALDHGQHVNITDTLACAYAAAGDFNQAVQLEQQAIQLAQAAKAADVTGVLQARLALFQNEKPYRE